MAAAAAEGAARKKAARQGLFVACMNGDVAAAAALLEAGDVGANEVVHGLSKAPPLSAAVRHPALMRLLVERHGARVDARRGDGSTALMDAAEAGLAASATLLCDEWGADLNLEDADGNTALDLARRETRTAVAAFLEDRGALRGHRKTVAAGDAPFATFGTMADAGLGFDLDGATELNARWAAPPAPNAAPRAPVPRCARCDKPEAPGKKLVRCSRCRVAVYCSRDCQKAAWPQHKGGCRRKPAKPPAPAAPK